MVGNAGLRHEIEATFVVVPSKSTADEITFLCPECGDKNGHRSVNLRTGLTNCFRCGKGQHNKGNFVLWAKALGYQFSAEPNLANVSMEQLEKAQEREKFYLPPPRALSLPSGFTLIADDPTSIYSRSIVKMAQRKHLTKEDFLAARTGFTRDNPEWEPYAIFPVFDTGHIVYYQGRTYVDIEGNTTKHFPKRADVPWGAKYWVYNIDSLRYTHAPIALIVESVLNVLSLKRKLRQLGWKHVVPVCIFKHHISRYQFARLLQCKEVKEFCFLFDHDAIAEMWRMSPPAVGRRITIAEMPLGQNRETGEFNEKLDANDDVDTAIEAFENRISFNMSTQIAHQSIHQYRRKVPNWSGKRIKQIRSLTA